MNSEKVTGQLKETTGKLTGDKGMETEGKIERAVGEVKGAVGGAVSYVVEMVGAAANTVIGVIGDLYEGAKKMGRKVF